VTKVRDASGEPSAGAHDHRLGACGGPVPPETAGYGRAYATEIVRGPEEMYLANYLRILHQSEQDLADAFRKVGEGYAAEADVYHTCNTLAKQCELHAERLRPFLDRYGEERDDEPERLYRELFDEIRGGSLGLLRDLYVMANFCDINWTMIGQAAQRIADK
jgi:hypothetical protein